MTFSMCRELIFSLFFGFPGLIRLSYDLVINLMKHMKALKTLVCFYQPLNDQEDMEENATYSNDRNMRTIEAVTTIDHDGYTKKSHSRNTLLLSSL